VFAAASLTDVFNEIVGDFEASTGIEVTVQYAGSSRLAAQIAAGAQADVLASANHQAVAGLQAKQTLVFAGNRLAIAVAEGNPAAVTGLDSLSRGDLVLAICAPEVPCGALAEAVGGAELIAKAATQEAGVRSVLTKVLIGEVDAGLVYETDARASGVTAIAVPESPQVPYPLLVLSDKPQAQAFADFVLSEQAQATLRDAGFGPP